MEVFSKTKRSNRRIFLNLAPASSSEISHPWLVLPLHQDRFPGNYSDTLAVANLTSKTVVHSLCGLVLPRKTSSMSFKSYRSSQSKFRRSNRRNVSAQAEPCELRALLSASAITMGLAQAPTDPLATSVLLLNDTSAGDPVDGQTFAACLSVVDPVTSDLGVVPSGIMFMKLMQPGDSTNLEGSDPVVDSAKVDDSSVVDNSTVKVSIDDPNVDNAPPVDGWDPSWAYRSFIPFDGNVPADGVTGNIDNTGVVADNTGNVDNTGVVADNTDNVDNTGVAADDAGVKVNIYYSLNPNGVDAGVPVDGTIASEDVPPVDGWDQSWLYRSFAGSSGGALDDAGNTGVLMLKDGVPVDEVKSDNSNNGVDPVVFMTFGGVVKDSEIPVDDSGSSNSDQVPKDVTDSLDTGLDDGSLPVDGKISVDDPSVLAAQDAVPQIRYFSLGGPEVQRTVVSSSEPAAATPPVAPAPSATIASPSSIATNNMPVRQTNSASLFNSSRDKAAIGVALTSPSSFESIGSSIGTKSSSTPKRSISQLQSISHNSAETSGLESLSPLIGDDADSPEVDSATSRQEMQTDDQVTTEPNVVSSNESVESISNVVVQSSRPSSIIRPRMIDEVMSQYAENSYNA